MKDAPTYIYVITNPCLVKVPTKQPGKSGLVEPVKIGRARDVPKRLGTLNTSMTENFVDRLVVKLESERDAIVLENVVQEVLDGLRIYTSDGSSTEFFACPYQYAVSEVKRLAKKLHFKLTEFKRIGYVGRSSVAIRKNHMAKVASRKTIPGKSVDGNVDQVPLEESPVTWNGKTQLAKAIARRGGNEGAFGGILHYFSRMRPCVKTSKWRKLLENVGLRFDENDFVVDWGDARNPL